MSTPILHSEDEHRLVLEAPRMGSTIFGSLAALVLLVVWALFPDHRIAQGVFLIMALVGFTGLLHVHRLVLDLDQRTWTYRDGWTWQPPVAEGTFEDLGRVAIEENEVRDGLVTSKLRSRLVFLEFDRFEAADGSSEEGRFPLGFAMGPNVAPDHARHYADLLGIEVVDRTGAAPDHGGEADRDGAAAGEGAGEGKGEGEGEGASGPPPEPGSARLETPRGG